MSLDLDSKGRQRAIAQAKPNPSGYDAYGVKIPYRRLTAALKMLRTLAPGITTEHATKIIGRVATHIEDDQPYKCMEVLFPHHEYAHGQEKLDPPSPLDLTGAYMVLSYLLTG